MIVNRQQYERYREEYLALHGVNSMFTRETLGEILRGVLAVLDALKHNRAPSMAARSDLVEPVETDVRRILKENSYDVDEYGQLVDLTAVAPVLAEEPKAIEAPEKAPKPTGKK